MIGIFFFQFNRLGTTGTTGTTYHHTTSHPTDNRITTHHATTQHTTTMSTSSFVNTSTSTTGEPPDPGDDSNRNWGVVIGIVLALGGVVVVLCVVRFFWNKKKKKSQVYVTPPELDEPQNESQALDNNADDVFDYRDVQFVRKKSMKDRFNNLATSFGSSGQNGEYSTDEEIEIITKKNYGSINTPVGSLN